VLDDGRRLGASGERRATHHLRRSGGDDLRDAVAPRRADAAGDRRGDGRRGARVAPPPDGDAYLGFIFARGEAPDLVESTLCEAHARLTLHIAPLLPSA
jgi:hypothetical protein